MGHQLLGLASGARTIKVKHGNRGNDIPCTNMITGRFYITSQNHGYAIDTTTLSEDYMKLFINANDGSNEGIIHKMFPIFSVQFHPESTPGPRDVEHLFDVFVDNVRESNLVLLRTFCQVMCCHLGRLQEKVNAVKSFFSAFNDFFFFHSRI